MEKDKKVTSPEKDLKIVSRPSNEELSDDIVDEEKPEQVKKRVIKKSTKTDLGEGIED